MTNEGIFRFSRNMEIFNCYFIFEKKNNEYL